MDVIVKNIDEVKKKLKEIQDLGDATIMGAVANEAIKVMVDRTTSGQDVDHNTFDGYSEYYKKKSGKGNPPDLKKSGNMLRSLKYRVINSLEVVVKVVGEKAYNIGVIHQAGKQGMPQRKWFGIEHNTDKEKVMTKFKKLLLAQVYKKWNR